jgi:hypothetical protein
MMPMRPYDAVVVHFCQHREWTRSWFMGAIRANEPKMAKGESEVWTTRWNLTTLSGSIQGLDREMRLLRLQLDSLAGTVPCRLTVIEQSFRELVGEVARGFGQVQQQMARPDKRLDAMDAAITALRGDLGERTEQILQAIRAGS